MKQHLVKIKSIRHITHDVLQIVTEKPDQYDYTPGQATEIAINKDGWKDKKRPFTFTCLPNNNFLEFTIKTYPSHKGVTNEFLKLKKDDELIVHDVFGAIAYKGEGVFIAGGAGVTPFICIFRYLQSKNKISGNKLIFANKTKKDIILSDEFKELLGKNFINILSDEKVDKYAHGQITASFLKSHIDGSAKKFYVCGPPPMMEAIKKQLATLEVDENAIIVEEI
ncbi:MAG: flavodoxin reductase [Bacteroidetes bacterium GWF2_42_66]|nr:MAG: flavodoxin reductase [Bacteroidetes bacterium GWA2_42_15]OFY01741.1 MAG: flavodoxin reductase [Bacteroidetes bacterium GWE2_42_39]OFY46488.1 MAG: flavodoxin reductase [Bacteroidetes bacterium GWF2_42_66]HAZ02923.1 flavodoxin reductase [Marinilabiliales bacterium]HBL76102.1 flavodoxin reductase [Prolixibacteraceae bacterium]